MAAIGVGSRHDAIFQSVFPPTDYTTPTPEATPDIGVLSSPGRPFGGFNIPADAAHEAVQIDRAWSTATRYLAIKSTGHRPNLTRHDVQAFDVLFAKAEKVTQLAEWQLNEIRSHFRNHVPVDLTQWQQPVPLSTASELVNKTVHILQTAQSHYLYSLEVLVSSARRTTHKANAIELRTQVVKRWHLLVLHSFPAQRLQKVLASALYQHMKHNLADHSNPEKCLRDAKCQCRLDFRALPLQQLHEIGLGGDLAERALALATHRLLDGPAVERRCFQVDWSRQQTVVPRLRDWIHACFAPAIAGAIGSLIGAPFNFSGNDISRMATNAASNLVRKRTDALFDYVKLWPHSMGALLDIKEHLVAGSTAEKASLCAAFASQTQHRLLHAGASTAEILSIYVNVIHVFKILDARGVLLEKVGVPIRSYLRARDDTVSIIAASFLAEISEVGKLPDGEGDKICVDIAREVQTSSLEDARDHKTLNWDDMNWMPDPIDAGPDHKFNKSEDVLSYIIGLFEQEDFIKEVTTVLAQHLLQASDPDFAKETRLVELFKSRFDPSKLQAAEVMLKDMRDSVMLEKRIFPKKYRLPVPTPRDVQDAIPTEGITLNALYGLFESRMKQPEFLATIKVVALRRGDLYFPKRGRLPQAMGDSAQTRQDGTEEVDVSLRILSSFFWPELRSSKFRLPEDLVPVLLKMPEQFARYSGQRTLEWQDALARMSVTLELEDRTVSETDIPAWRGSVINAFASERTDNMLTQSVCDYDNDAGLTSKNLEEKLQMDPELVADALNFWLTRRVLYQRSPGHYFVLEHLDMDTGPPARLVASESEAFSAIKSQDAMLKENAPMFETFIANMLQNGGAKEVGGFMGITNMMKMVLPTFTYGEDEVLFLLGEMECRGEVTRNGEMWATAK